MTSRQLKELREKFSAEKSENIIDKEIAAGFLVKIGDVVHDYTVNSVLSGKPKGEARSTGVVIKVSDGVATIDGLTTAMSGELLSFASGATGLALNLEKEKVGSIVISGFNDIVPGESVSTTGKILSIGVTDEIIGRVVNPLGVALDGKGKIEYKEFYPLEKIAPGVIDRSAVNRPLQTGIKAIDGMIPVGRGQRELIIGDRQTGKTAIGLTTIINQKDVICIYVAIGQKKSSVAQFIATLEEHDAMKHTIVVLAGSSDSAATQYLAPYAGTAIGEYFLDQGKDVLIIYDDLTKHAWAYREVSLLLGRPSGREAYPGDIFYAHSRLLERACQMDSLHGGGSLTALPIIETQGGDVSAYIPTNVISITDGQIYLSADLFNQGMRPAIDVGNSVSRVGSSAQIKAMKQVAGRLRLDLAQFRELEAFAQFASDLDEKTQSQLSRGAKLYELLKQPWDKPLSIAEQVVAIWAAVNGYLDQIPNEEIGSLQDEIFTHIRIKNPDLFIKIEKEKVLNDKLIEEIKKAVEEVVEEHKEEYGG